MSEIEKLSDRRCNQINDPPSGQTDQKIKKKLIYKKPSFRKLTSDSQGHYDIDGVSYEGGKIYLGSCWPLNDEGDN